MPIRPLIYGSQALKHWYPDLPRIPNDQDILSMEKIQGWDCHWDDRLIDMLLTNVDDTYLDSDLLLTMKMSHLPWKLKNNSWWKHLKDVIFLQHMGVEPKLEWIPTLHSIWTDKHGSKDHIKLTEAESKFFTGKVSRVIEHDELHKLVNPTPTYQMFKMDDSVAFDMSKWNAAPHQDKINCIVEESMVLALERNMQGSSGFQHLVTSCSKGTINFFCIEHAEEILNQITNNRTKFNQIRQILEELQHDNGK